MSTLLWIELVSQSDFLGEVTTFEYEFAKTSKSAVSLRFTLQLMSCNEVPCCFELWKASCDSVSKERPRTSLFPSLSFMSKYSVRGFFLLFLTGDTSVTWKWIFPWFVSRRVDSSISS